MSERDGGRHPGRHETNMDWVAWLDIADQPGGIGLSRTPLVGHRIHEGSETSATISQGDRYREDLEIFERLWPAPVARLIASVYTRSYRSNKLPATDESAAPAES